ncbi:cysteine protease [Tulasnella sp. 330]|nr:cysteine protease [Tulasnella sp. 330]KAG8888690.1 cysteine protease [Tulasnella sp. 332]
MQSATPLSLAEADAVLAEAAVKVSKADLAGALPLYIKAAQAYLHLSRTLTAGNGQIENNLKIRCRERASQALQRAEQIKAAKHSTSSPSLRPVQRDRFSTEEQYAIIDQSSRINKLKVVPWKSPPADSEFVTSDPFLDIDGLPSLSIAQTNQLLHWIRPSSAAGDSFIMWTGDMPPEDIVQDVITNCSVIAALAVCWQHHQRFNSKLCVSSIYPQDENGMPRLSQNGKYVTKLFLNGTSRQHQLNCVGSHRRPFTNREGRTDALRINLEDQ